MERNVSNAKLYRCKCAVVNVVFICSRTPYIPPSKWPRTASGRPKDIAVTMHVLYYVLWCSLLYIRFGFGTQTHTQHKPLVITRVYHHFHMCATTTEIHHSLSPVHWILPFVCSSSLHITCLTLTQTDSRRYEIKEQQNYIQMFPTRGISR